MTRPHLLSLTLGLCLLCSNLMSTPAAQANSSLDQQGNTTPLRLSYLDSLSLFDGKHQRLILSPHMVLPPGSTRVCWVIPTPAAITHATSLEPDAFRDLERRIRTGRIEHAKPAKALMGSKPLLKEQLTAPDAPPLSGTTELEIIKATGEAALKPLNDWLTTRKCSPLEPAQLDYYTERQWRFVAISRFVNTPNTTLTGARHEPIALTFSAERAILPLKAPWSTTPFPTRYHLLSLTPQGLESLSSPISRGFELSAILGYPGHSPGAKTARYTTEPDRIKLEQLPSSWRALSRSPFRGDQTVQLRVLWLPHNEGKANPNTWIEELAIPTPPETMRLEGDPSSPAPSPTPKDAHPKDHIKLKTATTTGPTPNLTPQAPAPSSSCALIAAPAQDASALMLLMVAFLISSRSKLRRIKTRRP